MKANQTKTRSAVIASVAEVATRKRRKVAEMARGRPRKETLTVDTAWFEARLRGAGLSQRGLAAKLARDVSIISRTLHGSREATAGDVAQFADLLGVPANEVLRRLGYEVKPLGVTITGALRPDGRITAITAKSGHWHVLPPADTSDKALIAETRGGPLSAYAGAVICYQESPARTVPPDAIGRLCVVESADEVVPMLGTLSKADRRGLLRFAAFGTGEERDLAEVIRAHVVTRIVFP